MSVRVTLDPDGGTVTLKLTAYLGGERFAAYRDACYSHGARFVRAEKANRAPLDALPGILASLRSAEIPVEVDRPVRERLEEAAGEAETLLAAGRERVRASEERLAGSGLALYPYQRTGVEWLAPRERALLADQMGCVDGAALVHANRAGRGFAIRLDKLHDRFHGISGRWDRSIPTKVRSMCGDEVRLNGLRDVIRKGRKPVVRVLLRSGKSLRLTPDHEVATPGGFVRADALVPGDEVLTNGTPRCLECGSTERVVTYRYAKFRGFCKRCVYRQKRTHPRYTGRAKDKDGYVRVARNWDHPRANRAGQVLEHVLVMEDRLGRPVGTDEVVHHRNGNRADNRVENLELMTVSEHANLHGKHGGYRRLHGSRSARGGLVVFEPIVDHIVSVDDDGEAEVYDLVCEDPHRNFVANGIVVHNCGKTVQALLALPESAATLVVAPAVVRSAWVSEVRRWRPDLEPVAVGSRKTFRWPAAGEVLVVTYGVLPGDVVRDEEGQDTGKLALEQPMAPDGMVVIADEAHAIKNPKALRTRRFRAVVETALASRGRVWLVTGTPLLNRPPELWNVLKAAGLEGRAFGNWYEFVRMFGGAKGRYGYQWGDPDETVPDALRKVMLSRRREEVLPDLPTKTHQNVEVEIDEEARRALDEVVEELAARGIDVREAAREAIELGTRGSLPFELLSRARSVLATAKVAAAVDLATLAEESGEPLVVFSAHRAPALALGERKGWATIVGGTPPEERGRIVEAFQAGELRGVAGTIGAMGVGVTLTRAHQVMVVDLDWTPALNQQAEDRVCRIGQDRGVIVTRIVADHVVDRRMTELLAEKQRVIEASVEAAAVEADYVGSSPAEEIARAAREAAEVESVDVEATMRDAAETRERISRTAAEKRLGDAWDGRRLVVDGIFRGPANPVEDHAGDAILRLAADDPDRAAEENGVGFNRYDGEFGHSLAARYRERKTLSDKQWAAAVKLAQKYRRQVGDAPATEQEAKTL